MKKILTLAIGGVFAAMLAFPVVSTAETDPLIGKYCLQFDKLADILIMQIEMSSPDNYSVTGTNPFNGECALSGGGGKASDETIYLAITEVCPNIHYTSRMTISLEPDSMTGSGDAIWSNSIGDVIFIYIDEEFSFGPCEEIILSRTSKTEEVILSRPSNTLEIKKKPQTKPSMTGY